MATTRLNFIPGREIKRETKSVLSREETKTKIFGGKKRTIRSILNALRNYHNIIADWLLTIKN